MSVLLSTPLLNDELTWIRRLEKLRRRKLFTIGQFGFRYLQYTVTYAAGNDREYGPALCWFLNLPAPGHNNFVGNRRQRQCGATDSADDQSKLLALAKIVRDEDSPEGGMRCVGIKIYPFLLSSEPLS